MAKSKLTCKFQYNGFNFVLDGEDVSCLEVKESSYIHNADDRVSILLQFDSACRWYGEEYRATYEKRLHFFLDQIKAVCVKPNNKWLYEIIVQELTCNGWEDSCAESTIKEAKATVRDYRNEGISARIINRRTPNPDYVAK